MFNMSNIQIETEPVFNCASHGAQCTIHIAGFVMRAFIAKNDHETLNLYKSLHKNDYVNITVTENTICDKKEKYIQYQITELSKIK